MRDKKCNPTFEHFCKTKDYYNVSWLFLASLVEVAKEKVEIRFNFSAPDSHNQSKRFLVCSEGESSLSYSHKVEVAKNQT